MEGLLQEQFYLRKRLLSNQRGEPLVGFDKIRLPGSVQPPQIRPYDAPSYGEKCADSITETYSKRGS